uniref:Aurora kinase n=1 Tax=Panagrellus redivivus TaxID=6233 RepID=A0A7E4UZB1_PANRE
MSNALQPIQEPNAIDGDAQRKYPRSPKKRTDPPTSYGRPDSPTPLVANTPQQRPDSPAPWSHSVPQTPNRRPDSPAPWKRANSKTPSPIGGKHLSLAVFFRPLRHGLLQQLFSISVMPKHQSIKGPIAGVLSFSVARPEKKVCVAADFEFEKMLGKGGFGTVHLCREMKTNKTLAIKMVQKSKLTNAQALVQMQREIELQDSLRHNHILLLLGYFDDPQHVYILLEACQLGSLYRYVRKHKGLSLHRATYVIDCMADALNYCHIRRVIHRDVKPENVLLTEQFEPKLADFGWAVRSEKKTQETLCGTPDYLSPEMLNSSKNHAHTYKVDNWALGVLYYECLSDRAPFHGKDQEMTFQNIEHARIQQNSKIPADAMKIIKGLLTIDVKKRSELNDVRDDQFIRFQVEKYNSNKSVRRDAK